MTVPLEGTGGLFTRLGKIGGLVDMVNTHRGVDIGNQIEEIDAEYLASDQPLRDGLYSARLSYRGTQGGILAYCQSLATSTIVAMVNADRPMAVPSLQPALLELKRQMEAASESLNEPTVGVGAITYRPDNRGDGVLTVTTLGAYGLSEVTAFAETLGASCTGDNGTGSTAGSEPFTLLGPAAVDRLAWDYEKGSGATVQLTSVNPSLDNAGGNLLVNSAFNTWAANLPTGWECPVGVPGTDVAPGGSSDAYFGANCLKFSQAAGNPLSAITQKFNTANQTPAALLPLTVYGVQYRAKKVAGLVGAGTLEVALIDATTGVVLQDEEAVDNKYQVAASTLTTSYTAKSAYFRTPRTMPTGGVKLRVRMSTALADVSAAVYVDWLGLVPAVRVYNAGPLCVLWSGKTPWSLGDTVTAVITNNYAGKFVRLLERLLNLRAFTPPIMLPFSGTPTIPDALIS